MIFLSWSSTPSLLFSCTIHFIVPFLSPPALASIPASGGPLGQPPYPAASFLPLKASPSISLSFLSTRQIALAVCPAGSTADRIDFIDPHRQGENRGN
jgi:hypothetical protein